MRSTHRHLAASNSAKGRQREALNLARSRKKAWARHQADLVNLRLGMFQGHVASSMVIVGYVGDTPYFEPNFERILFGRNDWRIWDPLIPYSLSQSICKIVQQGKTDLSRSPENSWCEFVDMFTIFHFLTWVLCYTAARQASCNIFAWCTHLHVGECWAKWNQNNDDSYVIICT